MTAEEMWNVFSAENGLDDCEYDAWSFGCDADLLAQLVLDGVKTATASAYPLYEAENEALPMDGEYSVILDSEDNAMCIIQTKRVYVVPFNEVSPEHACKEGEGDRSLEYWRKVHRDFFSECMEEAGLSFTPDMKVVCEEFEVVYKPTGNTKQDTTHSGKQPDISCISEKYSVKKLSEEDAEQIYELELGNPVFFEYCPPAASTASVLEDMKALPPGTSYDDKFYIGFYQNEQLIAVMDLILHFPDADTAFIGFFMMKDSLQGKGIGSEIIDKSLAFLKKEGFSHVRLGYMKGNEQSRHFWVKNGFSPTGVEADNGQGIVVVMQTDIL